MRWRNLLEADRVGPPEQCLENVSRGRVDFARLSCAENSAPTSPAGGIGNRIKTIPVDATAVGRVPARACGQRPRGYRAAAWSAFAKLANVHQVHIPGIGGGGDGDGGG